MRNLMKAGILSALVVLATSALALAASPGWVGNNATESNGVVTLVNDGSGSSYENPALDIPVENGDTISFQWRSDDVTCAGGVPRVFIQGGAYNTFDADPAGPGACGTAPDADGWRTVTGTVTGIVDGNAGYTGIVNDNPSDPGTIQVRNLVINGVAVLPPTSADQCKKDGWKDYGTMFKNQGDCVAFVKTLGKNEPGKNVKG